MNADLCPTESGELRSDCENCIKDAKGCNCDLGYQCHNLQCRDNNERVARSYAWMSNMATTPVGVAEAPQDFDHRKTLFLDGECNR